MKFFSSILKQKKIIIFAFLFLTVAVLLMPQFGLASVIPGVDAIKDGIAKGLADAAKATMNGLIFAALIIPLAISAATADIVGMFLQGVLFLTTDGASYTNNTAVNIGWPIVRDLANMIIVLGFVIIGIATTLRIESYKAKKTLFPLIIAALLINFSLLICGVFIDASNITTKFFLKSDSAVDFYNNSSTKTVINLASNITADNPVAFIVKAAAIIAYNLIAIIVFAMYGFLFAMRIFALWILVIFSPLAFVCYVFPFTRKVWDMWWSNFFQWCLISIPASFFLYLAVRLKDDMTQMTHVFNWSSLGDFAQSFTDLGTFIVPALFLIAGFIFSMQISAIGGGIVKSAGAKLKTGGAAALGGAFTKASGGLGKQAGKLGNYLQGSNNKIGQGAGWVLNNTVARGANAVGNYRATSAKTRSAFGRGLEAIGMGGETGTYALGRSEELNKGQKRMSALISEGKLNKVLEISEGKGVGTSTKERGAAIGALLESKNFDIGNAQHREGLVHFQNNGGDLGKYADKDPRLSEHNRSAINNTMTKYGVPENKAKEILRDRAYQGLGINEMRSLSPEAADLNFYLNVNPEKNEKASDEYSPAMLNQLKKYVTPGTAENTQLRTEQTRLQTESATQRGAGNLDLADELEKKRDLLMRNAEKVAFHM